VDVGARAGAITNGVQERIATAVLLTIDHLVEDGRELNQLQKIALIERAVRAFDGLERDVVTAIVRRPDGGGREHLGTERVMSRRPRQAIERNGEVENHG